MTSLNKILLPAFVLFLSNTNVNAALFLICDNTKADYCKDVKKFAYKQNKIMLYAPDDVKVYSEFQYGDKLGKSLAKKLHKTMYNVNNNIQGVFNAVKKDYQSVNIKLKELRLGSFKTIAHSKKAKKSFNSVGIKKFYDYYEENSDDFMSDLFKANSAAGIFFAGIETDLQDIFLEDLRATQAATIDVKITYYNADKGSTDRTIIIKAKLIGGILRFEKSKKIKHLLNKSMTELFKGEIESENALEEDF